MATEKIRFGESGALSEPSYLKPLLEGLKQYHLTKEHADITVICGGQEWQAHKLVLCSLSPFFMSMFNSGRFKESQEGKVNLDDDDPEVVGALMHYFYNFDYDSPATDDDFDPAEHNNKTPAMVFDVRMYAIADKFLVQDLKILAAKKFAKRAKQEWTSSSFAEAVAEIYSITGKGSRLSHRVVSVVKKHSDELLDSSKPFPDFRRVLRQSAELGADIAMGGAARSLEMAAATYECPHCQTVFAASLAEGCKFSCPADCVDASWDAKWWGAYAVED